MFLNHKLLGIVFFQYWMLRHDEAVRSGAQVWVNCLLDFASIVIARRESRGNYVALLEHMHVVI
jgi:hypothetical protein